MKDKEQLRENTFQKAVNDTPQVSACYKEGKQAILGKERDKIQLTDATKCGGSLFIDECLINKKLFPNDHRWDYAIDYDGEVFFFEVHSAKTDEVSTIIKKLEWLKQWLREHAPNINSLRATSKTPYYWVQSNGYHILKNSAQERLIQQKGLKPIAKLKL